MPETITLSFSQISNQLTTHFNNFQEERFHSDPGNLNNLVHIAPKSTVGSKFISNLYPRSILYDYANGTGALDPFMFFESNPQNSLQPSTYQEIQLAPPISTTTYQNNVNNGAVENVALDHERTDYWSDFSKVTYKPSLLLKHPEFNYDPKSNRGVGKNIPSHKFLTHQQGIDCFHTLEHFESSTDDQIRNMFEEANSVNQVNVVVELDTAWSGVCSETLKYLIDDQLNGKGSKVMIWSLQNDGEYVSSLTNVGKLDRIRKLMDLGNTEAAGFVPLNLNLSTPLLKNSQSMWEKTAFLSIPFDFYNSIQSTDISELLHKLTDNGVHKFINKVELLWDNQTVNLGVKDIFNTTKVIEKEHVFSKSVLHSPNIANERLDQFLNFETLVQNGTPRLFLQKDKIKQPFKYIDSLPQVFRDNTIDAVSLTVTDSLRENFKDMHSFVSRYCRTDEREELKDSLDTLKEAYTFGYEFSDEDEDD